jgi:hypothetical protein
MWTLDETPVSTAGNSYQYTPKGGEHALVVKANHILWTDTQTWTVIDAEVAKDIGSAGGTIEVTEPTSPIAGAKAEIPAGAVSGTQTLTISQVNTPAGLPGQAAGPCIHFGPEGTQFADPVDLYLPYADVDDDGMVDGTGIPEDQVKAWYYSEMWRTWREVTVLDCDPVNNRVHIQATHFSFFATNIPVLTWNKTYGGSGYDIAWSVRQTKDGGYILAGETDSYGAGSIDVWLIKTDADGNEQWNKPFGGSDEEDISSVQQTSDGGYVLAGMTRSYGAGDLDAWLIKTDANGNEQWNKPFGGSGQDYALSSQQTSDGGYILAGLTESYGAGSIDAWLIKTDADGNEQWNKTFGGSVDDYALSSQQTSDGGYILAGMTRSYGAGDLDAWLIKTDADGNEQWNKTFGGSVDDYAYSVQQTSDEGYILAGITDYKAWLIKTDANGNKIWDKTFDDHEKAVSVQQTKDGGYILAGQNGRIGFVRDDAWLIKTDVDGNEQWNKTFGVGDYSGCSVQQTSDGGYVLAGYSGGWDAWLIKTDAEGNAPATPTP